MKNHNPGYKIDNISISAHGGSIYIAFGRGKYINVAGDKATNITTHTWRMSNASVMRAARAILALDARHEGLRLAVCDPKDKEM